MNMDQYKICYTAKWPDGKLLDPKKPFMEAFIEGASKEDAMMSLKNEFPGLKLKVVEEPQKTEVEDGL